jgi:hypothetical protein
MVDRQPLGTLWLVVMSFQRNLILEIPVIAMCEISLRARSTALHAKWSVCLSVYTRVWKMVVVWNGIRNLGRRGG